MVSLLTIEYGSSSPDQSKQRHKIGICCFSAKRAALSRSKIMHPSQFNRLKFISTKIVMSKYDKLSIIKTSTECSEHSKK
jgi:hypothetical protein